MIQIISMRLEELEREEAALEGVEEEDEDLEPELPPEELAALAEIKKRQSLLKQEHRIKKSTAESRPINRARSKSRGRKRDRSTADHSMDVVDGDYQNYKKKLRMMSRSRPPSSELVPGEGFRDSAQKQKAIKIGRSKSKKRNKEARRGEADRVIPNLRPKHLLTGKRSTGKTQRR